MISDQTATSDRRSRPPQATSAAAPRAGAALSMASTTASHKRTIAALRAKAREKEAPGLKAAGAVGGQPAGVDKGDMVSS